MSTDSALLKLPGELRNQIFEHYAASMTIKVRDGVAVFLPLARVCRQIRNELMSTLHCCLFHTAPIEAKVVDWEFGDLLAFLRKLKAHSNGTRRSLTVFIDVSSPCASRSEQLLEWCRQIHSSKSSRLRNMQKVCEMMEGQPMKFATMQIEEESFNIKHVIRVPSCRVTTTQIE